MAAAASAADAEREASGLSEELIASERAADAQLVEVAKELRDAQRKAWGKMQTLLQHTNCLLKLFTRAN